MTRTFDPVCFEAFQQLLAQPDADDLPRRVNLCRYEGDPNRRSTRLPVIITAWLQRRYLDLDVPEPMASAKRMPTPCSRPVNRGLRLLRATA
jgi:hypothetical protein